MQANKLSDHTLLFGITGSKDEAGIMKNLRSWGFTVENILSKDLFSNRSCHQRSFVLVPVFASNRPNQGKLRYILHTYQGLPCLGVFIGKIVMQDNYLAKMCNELIRWPCDRMEFSLRLDRMLQLYSKAETVSGDNLPNMVGQSISFKRVLQQIDTFAQCDAPVLVEGETGTGKELIARSIHYKSMRFSNPFIPVNCGALPDTLIENELFGHTRGAFTDAKMSQEGLVTQAAGGTLFFDEIEALSLKAQVTLLRFLQEQTFRQLGGSRILQADVRIISACNGDINTMITSGHLRRDLFFRLNILHVNLPPLRDRSEDIPLLVNYFLKRFSDYYKMPSKIICRQLMDDLNHYEWPGNVRELENTIHRAVLISQSDEIVKEELELGLPQTSFSTENVAYDYSTMGFSKAKSKVIEDFEKQYLHGLMQAVQGNVTLAAKRAQKERRALGKLLKKHGIDRNDYL